uniref:Cytochrome c oxidase subunit 4 n=1 Tax=Eulimnogammarus verrucosus TaxID=36941 RepID=A0A289Y1G1_EULVE|nr:mitochondrial cytochrome C oxidase subunit IV [Eulimnogammarus verrucosus]
MALRSVQRISYARVLEQALKSQSVRASSHSAVDTNDPYLKIGKREVVGYGFNGGLNYADRGDFPMPAIRFKEANNEILALREKEKGDWKKLTLEEKKALYRASFCQTFSEMYAPTGEWKVYWASILLSISGACWIYMTMKTFVLPPVPETFSPEYQQGQLRNMIELQVNPIDGLASKYDYEKGQWK